MRKLLSILAISFFTTIGASNLISCDASPISGGGSDKPEPPKPVSKDIEYYQKLLKTANETIQDFEVGIKDLEKWKDTIDDYEKVFAELIAEENSYLALVEDCNYNILFLQNEGNFNDSQLVLVKEYLNNELLDLQNELKTKQEYKTDYSSNELEKINADINTVKIEIAKYP